MNSLDSIVDNLLKSGKYSALIAGVTTAQSTRYKSVKGVISVIDNEPVRDDSLFCLYSCTKSITAMAILILIDQGKLELKGLAKKYLPVLEDFYVVGEDDIDDDTGEVKGSHPKPKTDITIEHLLLHIAGFAYLFTDTTYFKIMTKKRVFAGNPMETLFVPSSMPLVHEPGAKWTYGFSTDWLGLIVEAVSNQKLSAFIQENIFDKCGMTKSTFLVEDPLEVIKVHVETDEGILRPEKRPSVPYKPRIDMGGQGCFTTIDDFLKFLRVWLNYGLSPDTGTRLLKQSTVENAVKNHLPEGLELNLALGLKAELDDARSDGFSYAGCAVNAKNLLTGRPSGTLYWGGIANSFFWMDFKNQCAGYFSCQKLPFMNEECTEAYGVFEKEVYRTLIINRANL